MAWAVELARHDRLQFDPEILYVSAMLHDIGLVPRTTGAPWLAEVDGAIAAERLVGEAKATGGARPSDLRRDRPCAVR